MMKPEEIFSFIQVLQCTAIDTNTLPIYMKAVENNFNFGHEDCDDDDCDCHAGPNIKVDGLVNWKNTSPNYLEKCIAGTIFRGITKDSGLRQTYVLLAKQPEMIWIPISKTSELMGMVHKYHFDKQDWVSIAVEPLTDILDIMHQNATPGSFYKITDMAGTPISLIDDDDCELDALDGVYRAIVDDIEGGIKFYSANFMLEHLAAFGSMPDEWRTLLEHELGPDTFEDEEEETTEPKADTDGEATTQPSDYAKQLIAQVDSEITEAKPAEEIKTPEEKPKRDDGIDTILTAIDKELE